jgi:hypothetical protein
VNNLQKFQVAFITVTAALIASCVHSLPSEPKYRGWCFQAEGLSKKKCYETGDVCYRKQGIISDQHPWSKVTYKCQQTVF